MLRKQTQPAHPGITALQLGNGKRVELRNGETFRS